MTTKPVISLRQRALNYLSRREHSRRELQHKLAAFAEEGEDNTEEIATLLDDFQKRGWLSDERFAEQVVHAKQSRYGSMKIAHELREKGVDDGLVANAMDGVDDFQNAKSVWLKKFGDAPKTREAWAKQARFLQSRGFGFDVIKRVLNNTPEQ
ncbi:MAG TPA: recombination regulator RecX [Methylophilaceae bacterium]